jgi:hypothetical protein
LVATAHEEIQPILKAAVAVERVERQAERMVVLATMYQHSLGAPRFINRAVVAAVPTVERTELAVRALAVAVVVPAVAERHLLTLHLAVAEAMLVVALAEAESHTLGGRSNMDSLDFKLKFLENVNSFAFADGSVTTAKLADSAVTAAKIANSTITEGKLAFSAATTGKAIAMAIVFGG